MPRGNPRPAWPVLVTRSRLDEETGCILYTGPIRETGYATLLHRGTKKLVHRIVYEVVHGEIPAGLEIDHLCGVRHCINPAHLEAVTPLVNTRRARFGNAQKTHCDHGHAFTSENTRVDPKKGCRICRRCDADRAALYRARRDAA